MPQISFFNIKDFSEIQKLHICHGVFNLEKLEKFKGNLQFDVIWFYQSKVLLKWFYPSPDLLWFVKKMGFNLKKHLFLK